MGSWVLAVEEKEIINNILLYFLQAPKPPVEKLTESQILLLISKGSCWVLVQAPDYRPSQKSKFVRAAHVPLCVRASSCVAEWVFVCVRVWRSRCVRACECLRSLRSLMFVP